MPFPWPDRSSRHAAIAAARAQKERSQAGAEHAASLERQIERMVTENHFAASIASQVIACRATRPASPAQRPAYSPAAATGTPERGSG